MGSKTIPERRTRLQSTWLAALVGTLLAIDCALSLHFALRLPVSRNVALRDCLLSLTFALLVWRLRAATALAAACGGMICFLVTFATRTTPNPLESGLAPLLTLFVLTFLAGRAGRQKKELAGLAESRRGRNAAQVIANLGLAGLLIGNALLWRRGLQVSEVLALAALCEATADTVSSEIGQAFGGPPYLLTTLRRVEAGTDGAASLLGTLAGVAAAALIAGAGVWAMHLSPLSATFAFVGGIAGLFFDSLLGATLEPRDWLNNDLVNFTSTAFAALVAALLLFATGHRPA